MAKVKKYYDALLCSDCRRFMGIILHTGPISEAEKVKVANENRLYFCNMNCYRKHVFDEE